MNLSLCRTEEGRIFHATFSLFSPLQHTHSELICCDTCNPSYRLVAPVYPHQEQRLCNEEADAQVLVNGVTVTLETAEEAEGEETDEEADQREEDADPGDDVEEHVVDGVRVLGDRE